MHTIICIFCGFALILTFIFCLEIKKKQYKNIVFGFAFCGIEPYLT